MPSREQSPDPRRTIWLVAFNNRPFRAPPLGLLVVAQALSRSGLNAEVIHLGLDEVEVLIDRAEQQRPAPAVGFHVTAGPPMRAVADASSRLRQLGIKVGWGGPLPTAAPEACSALRSADLIIAGPGEFAPQDWVAALMGADGDKSTPPILHLANDRDAVAALQAHPDPRRLPTPESYLAHRLSFKRVAPLPLSRGCFRHCRFCAAQSVVRGRIHYEQQSVLAAARFWREELAADAVELLDDEISCTRPSTRRMIEEIRLPYFAQLHAKGVSREQVRWLKGSGCQGVKMGAESGSDTMLRRLRKGLTSADVERAVDGLLGAEMMVALTYIVGFPDERPQDLEATLQAADRLAAKDPRVLIRLCHYTPYPATALWVRSIALGFVPPKNIEQWSLLDIHEPQVPWVPKETMMGLVSHLNERLYHRRARRFERAEIHKDHRPLVDIEKIDSPVPLL